MQSNQRVEKNGKDKENPFWNLGLNVVIPSLILMKGKQYLHLNEVYALIIALAFPISYGVYDFIKQKKLNFFSALGLFSIIMTGGIGLLKLNKTWMVVKETAIPFLMGIIVIIAERLNHPLINKILQSILNFEKIEEHLTTTDKRSDFRKNLTWSNYALGATFFVSAILNYYLAITILEGQPGTDQFNESLGKMTALSFPVITVPSAIMVGLIVTFLYKSIKKLTNLEIEEIFKAQ